MNETTTLPHLKDWATDQELVGRINAMTEGEMNSLLLGLVNKPEWPAILRYLFARFAVAQNGLQTMDPVKNPTELARLQGALMGVQDIPNAVSVLANAAKKAETPK